jgi:hypothetical protein
MDLPTNLILKRKIVIQVGYLRVFSFRNFNVGESNQSLSQQVFTQASKASILSANISIPYLISPSIIFLFLKNKQNFHGLSCFLMNSNARST